MRYGPNLQSTSSQLKVLSTRKPEDASLFGQNWFDPIFKAWLGCLAAFAWLGTCPRLCLYKLSLGFVAHSKWPKPQGLPVFKVTSKQGQSLNHKAREMSRERLGR